MDRSLCILDFDTNCTRLLKHHKEFFPAMPETSEIPQEQWAQVVEKVGSPSVYKKIPVPKPAPDQVLVRIEYSGVCHSDLHIMQGEIPINMLTPLVGGHEGIGTVVARGELVRCIDIGDRAGVTFINGACRACELCRRGAEELCDGAGYRGQPPKLSGYMVDGTFQQYCLVKDSEAVPIPKGCGEGEDAAGLAPVMCAGVTAYRALTETGARTGDYVAIVGAGGGLGSFAVQYARAMGLRVIAIDGGDEKGQTCRDSGAETYIDYTTTDDLVSAVKAATSDGAGPHAAVLLAVSEGPFQQASEYVRKLGVVVCVGLPTGGFVKTPIYSLVTRMITVKGSYLGSKEHMVRAVDFYARGLIKTPYTVFGLSQLHEVYDLMRQNKINGRCVLDMSR
jgi:propanol-preferring alcohol dehydrogenase